MLSSEADKFPIFQVVSSVLISYVFIILLGNISISLVFSLKYLFSVCHKILHFEVRHDGGVLWSGGLPDYHILFLPGASQLLPQVCFKEI